MGLLSLDEVAGRVEYVLGSPAVGRPLPNGRTLLAYAPIPHRPGNHPVAVVVAVDVVELEGSMFGVRQVAVWDFCMPLEPLAPFTCNGSYFERRQSSLRDALAELDRRVAMHGGQA